MRYQEIYDEPGDYGICACGNLTSPGSERCQICSMPDVEEPVLLLQPLTDRAAYLCGWLRRELRYTLLPFRHPQWREIGEAICFVVLGWAAVCAVLLLR
jgi:hypothetical protein